MNVKCKTCRVLPGMLIMLHEGQGGQKLSIRWRVNCPNMITPHACLSFTICQCIACHMCEALEFSWDMGINWTVNVGGHCHVDVILGSSVTLESRVIRELIAF